MSFLCPCVSVSVGAGVGRTLGKVLRTQPVGVLGKAVLGRAGASTDPGHHYHQSHSPLPSCHSQTA